MRFIFLVFILFTFTANAQPPCSGLGATAQTAISVCGTGIYTQVSLPPCMGVPLPLITGLQCMGDNNLFTDNCTWYKIRVYQSGTLGFTITPSLPSDNYDWVLFDVTGRNPQDVYTSNLVVAYNQCSTTGNTGCSSTGMNTFNCSAPQSMTNPNFNSLFPVIVGSDYLLMVISNAFSGPTYSLNLNGGTAVVTNPAAPIITNISQVGCNTNQLKVTTNKDVTCAGVGTTGAGFTIPGAIITGITSQCTAGTNAVSEFIINLQNPLATGMYSLNVAPNTLFDVCGQPMTVLTKSFNVTTQSPPIVNQIFLNSCTPNVIKVALSKKVLCSSITGTGSEFTITTGTNTFSSITLNCSPSGSGPVTDTVLINLVTPLTQGNYVLNINNGTDGNTLIDTCSLSTTVGYTFAFDVPISPTAPVVTPTVTYCLNAMATQLTATGTNLLWYTSMTGGTGTATAPTPSTATATTTNYYVSQGNGACESPRVAIAVTVLAAIPAPTVVTPVNKCQFSTATAVTATGTNLLWYATLMGGVGTSIAPITTTGSTGANIYYVTQTISGCESTPRTQLVVNIAAKPLPPIVISPISRCVGAPTAPLTATGTNLLWYAASVGGTGSTTAPTPPNTMGTFTYYVTQTVSGCESDRDDIIVNVDVVPTAPAVSATPLSYCQNLFAPALVATGTNLMWYTVSMGGTGTSVTPVPLTSTVGVTTYYVSQSNGSCPGPRSSITVTITPSPPALTVTSPLDICQFATAPSLGVTPAAGATLMWYTTLTGGTGSATAPVINTAVTSSNTYYVTQTNGSCEATPRKILVVNVNGTLASPTATTAITYCQNATATALTATGTNLLWYVNSSGGTGSSTAPIPSTLVVGTISYYVSQSAVGGCESPRVGITVTVNPAPANAPTVTSPVTYCVGSATVPLVATGTNLYWFTTATGGVGSNAIPTPSAAIAGSTTYYVAERLGVCDGPRAAIVVDIIAYPAAPTVVSPQIFCPGSTPGPLTALGTNLLWYTGPVGGTGSNIAPTPNTSVLTTTTYFVSQSNGSCEGPRRAIVVTVTNPLVVNIGPNRAICEGSSVTFMPIVTPSGATYLWRPLGTTSVSTIDNVALLNATVSPTSNATYELKANIGTCERRDTVEVAVNNKPIVDAGPDKPICLGDSVLIIGTVTAGGPIASYEWTPIDSLRTPNSVQTYANPTKTTIYTLTVKTDLVAYGCDFTVTDFMKVIIQPQIYANAGNDTIAVKGVPHQLYGSGGGSYLWSSPSANVLSPFVKNPKAILNNDATFYLKVTDGVGCAGFDTVFVKVYDGPKYYIPNAFTPNEDGVNDIFRAIPVGLANTIYFRVFNRYGELVFETNQYLKGWDGTYKGKPQPNDVYIWIISGTDRNFNKINEKGTVNLIR